MSYYFRREQMRKGDFLGHPFRGNQYTDEVAVHAVDAVRNMGGRKVNTEAGQELKAIQHVFYKRLADLRYSKNDREKFDRDFQAEVRNSLGAGYEREAKATADRIWNEFQKNGPHQYFEPRTWMKYDLIL